MKILQKGLKFSYQPLSQKYRLLAAVRQVAKHLPDKTRSALLVTVLTLLRCRTSVTQAKLPIMTIAKCLKEENLLALQSDKEGGFVVLPDSLFQQKAASALEKNFEWVQFRPKK